MNITSLWRQRPSSTVNRTKNNTKTQLKSLALIAAAGMSSPSLVNAGASFDLGDGKSLSLGAGLRTQFNYVDTDAGSIQDFSVASIRLYMNGQANENIKFTFNTEKIDGQSVDVLDAIARFEFSKGFNVWMGRMLTPADRIEMNGPYYALSWNQYTQPLFPSDQGGQAGRFGRDEGVTVWGTSGKFQYAIGAFDGLQTSANSDDSLLYAGRFAFNFLNMEDNPAYYTSSTYYGSLGNILTAGVSFQSQADGTGSATESGDFSGFTVDLLSETVFEGGGVLTLEAEYKDFDADFSIATPAAGDCFCLFDGESYFVTAAYLVPSEMGPGKLQPYVRYVENEPSDANSSDLTEIGANYVIAGHNARLNLNFLSGDANISGYPGADVDSVNFGVQLQF